MTASTRLTDREMMQLYELLERYCVYHGSTRHTPVAMVDALHHVRRILTRHYGRVDNDIDPSHI